jgi:hypothetical protein
MRIRSVLALALFTIAIASAPLQAREQEDSNACVNDAMTVCPQYIPRPTGALAQLSFASLFRRNNDYRRRAQQRGGRLLTHGVPAP